MTYTYNDKNEILFVNSGFGFCDNFLVSITIRMLSNTRIVNTFRNTRLELLKVLHF